MKIAILGGGLTGITLAKLYQELGNEVVVLEKNPKYGGLCQSRTEQGFTFDIGGSHIIFSKDTEVLDFMHRALGENREMRQRNTKIFHRGKYIKYPFENGLHELDVDECFFCLNEFIRTLLAVERGETPPPENFREWMFYTFGKGIAELYLLPYNEKIWKYPASQMSCHWVEDRIPRPPIEDIIKSAIGIETEGYTHQIQFAYPRTGGIETLVRAIARPIEGCIRTNFCVSSIRRQNSTFFISNGEEELSADRVISTIPLQTLLPCLAEVPILVQKACDALKYNSLYCVFLGVREVIPTFSWVYIPDQKTGLFNRISFPYTYSPRVTPQDHSSILVEITFKEGDEVDHLTREELLTHVINSLLDIGVLQKRESVVYAMVERQKFAYVIYDLSYQENITRIRDFCKSRQIGLVGRFAQFEYLNMDGCIRNAINFVREHPCG
ncbi:MAG: FAD-dependent oxidoreductase [Methanomicrobiales archaeon]|nr:FAD-dependent oxidoreductase [Methanomicrobiales archaeon]